MSMNALGNQQKHAIRVAIALLVVLFLPCVACNRYYSDLDGRLEEGITYKSTNGFHEVSKLQRSSDMVFVMKYDTMYGDTKASGTFELSGNKLLSPSGEKVGKIKSNRSGKVLKVHLTINGIACSGYYSKVED